MKKFVTPEVKELEIKLTMRNNGNNDTNTHKGWCEMHKHPELGICTCGAGSTGNPS